MARGRFLTPDTTPDGFICVRFFIPVSDDLNIANFKGAVMLLANAENYEKFGSVEPEEIARAWLAAIVESGGLEECGG